MPVRSANGTDSSVASPELFFGLFWNRTNSNSSEILVRLKQIRSRALDNFEQIVHRRNFLELFGQKPLEKIDRDVIVLFSRQSDQPVDLLRDMNFLVERKFDRVACR